MLARASGGFSYGKPKPRAATTTMMGPCDDVRVCAVPFVPAGTCVRLPLTPTDDAHERKNVVTKTAKRADASLNAIDPLAPYRALLKNRPVAELRHSHAGQRSDDRTRAKQREEADGARRDL